MRRRGCSRRAFVYAGELGHAKRVEPFCAARLFEVSWDTRGELEPFCAARLFRLLGQVSWDTVTDTCTPEKIGEYIYETLFEAHTHTQAHTQAQT